MRSIISGILVLMYLSVWADEVEYSPPIRAYLDADLVVAGRVSIEGKYAVMTISQIFRNDSPRQYAINGRVSFHRDRYGDFSYIATQQPTHSYVLFLKMYKGEWYCYAGNQNIKRQSVSDMFPLEVADSTFKLSAEAMHLALAEFRIAFTKAPRGISPTISASAYAHKKGNSPSVLYALQHPRKLMNPYVNEPMAYAEPPVTPKEDTTIYSIVEQMPTYPSGQDSMMKFVQGMIKYPEVAKENGIQGVVYLQVLVEKDGHISQVNLVRGVSPVLDQEAIRIVESMPDWIPGRQRGAPVRCRFYIPIRFQLD